MAHYHYKPLVNVDEIRVIQLLTEKDHPRHAHGPIHCKVEHVSLNDAHLTAAADCPTKGCDGTWPGHVIEDHKENKSDLLLKKSLRRRIASGIHVSRARHPQLSSRAPESDLKSNHDQTIYTKEEQFSWRYTWGDFVALSYVWGDTSRKHEIFVDDIPVLVTENLEAALLQLRKHPRIQQGFRIWVDALSISQTDLEERADQVSRMKDIFSRAWHVVIWLGSAADNSDLAMTAMQFLSIRSHDEEPLRGLYHRVDRYIIRVPFFQWKHQHTRLRLHRTVIRAIHYFLARPYWRRLWIVQEVALSTRQSPVLCGDRCLLLEDVQNALEVIQGDGGILGRYIITGDSWLVGSQTQPSWDPTRGDIYTKSEKLWERPIALIGAQAEKDSPNTASTQNGTFEALRLSREAFATDEKDHVYGILGLPCLAGVNITPEYTLSAAEIFTVFSKSLFIKGDLNSLSLVNSTIPAVGTWYIKFQDFSRPRAPKMVCRYRIAHQGCRHSLRSWVICGSCPPNPTLLLPRIFSTLKSYTAPMFRDNTMVVHGVPFDTINTLSAFHATESDPSYPQNGPQRSSIYGSDSATKEAFWRTLVANSDRFGDPAPEAYGKILAPQIWDTGLNGVDVGLHGLKDFYQRNKKLMIFDKSLHEMIHGPKENLIQRVRRTATTEGRILRADSLQRDASLRAMRVLAWRRLVTTDGGYLGLVPAAAAAGDMIVLIIGCDVPLVLRPKNKWDKSQFTLIGECYVHGVMSSDIFLTLGRDGEIPIEQFPIC